jgi:hypothetical protein
VYSGYTDEAFHADIKKAEGAIDDMELQAMEEYKKGPADTPIRTTNLLI